MKIENSRLDIHRSLNLNRSALAVTVAEVLEAIEILNGSIYDLKDHGDKDSIAMLDFSSGIATYTRKKTFNIQQELNSLVFNLDRLITKCKRQRIKYEQT